MHTESQGVIYLGLIVLMAAILLAMKIAGSLWSKLLTSTTIFEFQRGVLYRKGKLVKVLEAGKYTLFKPWYTVGVLDVRSAELQIVNQEIVCTDNLAIRASVVFTYRIVDVEKAVLSNVSITNHLHYQAQLALREALSGLKVEEVLSRRNELSQTFVERLKAMVGDVGAEVTGGGIRDITFPGDVRKIMGQVAQAEKAAQASLAKSRAEVASLRALSNAARMMNDNPHLATLRTLQSLSEVAATSGNTIVFGMPPAWVPVKPNGAAAAEPSDVAED